LTIGSSPFTVRGPHDMENPVVCDYWRLDQNYVGAEACLGFFG